MRYIYEKGGYIFIKTPDKDSLPDWITKDYPGDAYFLLNSTTRIHFAKYFLPLLRDKVYTISKPLFDDIKNFKQNPSHEPDAGVLPEFNGIKLKPHQIKAIELMMRHDRYGFFHGTGSGKTITALFYLNYVGKHKHIVIVTPKKVIKQYQKETIKHLPGYTITEFDNTKPYTVTIINFESLHKLKYKWIDCMIVDESHHAKNFMSDINKHLRNIAQSCSNIYLFTGTPIDKLRYEIFPQLSILDSRVYPSKTRFNYRYFEIDDYHQPKKEKKIFKEELDKMILEYTDGVKTEEVVELPPIHFIEISCDKPVDYHDEIAKKRFLEIDGITFEANTPAELRIKQQEICSGFLLNGEELIGDKIKLRDKLLYTKIIKQNALRQLLNAGHSVTLEDGTVFNARMNRGIIFTCFDLEIMLVSEVLKEQGKKFSIINGETSNNDVDKAKTELFEGKIDYIIANAKCANAGLDLYCINYVLFYSSPDSYITYHQCYSRMHRMGQVNTCYVLHFICKDSVETKKYKALRNKKSFTNKLYKLY